LIRLWEQQNEALIGAWEAYQVDLDMKELMDTLLLVVKHAGYVMGFRINHHYPYIVTSYSYVEPKSEYMRVLFHRLMKLGD
jgi:hypothetical protein